MLYLVGGMRQNTSHLWITFSHQREISNLPVDNFATVGIIRFFVLLNLSTFLPVAHFFKARYTSNASSSILA
jgi:hypothetical protein